MLVELVKTTTADGMRLDGALHVAQSDIPPPTAIEVLIALHGVGSNFYGSTLMEDVTPSLLQAGISVLRVNTRGHDGIHTAATTGGPVRQGAAYEVVDQCRYDVAAWIEFLRGRRFQRIGLLGHSLGAIKAVYSQAYEPHPENHCVIAMSPPRLSHAEFLNDERREDFLASLAEARRHVDAGQGETLMETRFPFPLIISAASYLDKYGASERYNILRLADRLRCPALFTYGELELQTGAAAFAGVPEALQQLSPSRGSLEVLIIAAADHVYTNARDRAARQIIEWLAQRQADR